jgi:hypothetical protein
MKSDSETGLTGKHGQDRNDCGTSTGQPPGLFKTQKTGFKYELMNFQPDCSEKLSPAGPVLDKLLHRLRVRTQIQLDANLP